MLKLQELTELENYIRSGKLEKDFHDGCENDRQYLLELMEKLMVLGELADEAATRLIYRGLNPVLNPASKADQTGKKENF